MCSYILKDKAVRTRSKCVLIYSKTKRSEQDQNVFLYTQRQSGQNKIKMCSYILKDKAVRTRSKCVLIYSKTKRSEQDQNVFLYTQRQSGQNKIKMCSYILKDKAVRTRSKCVLIYSKTDHANLCSLPWTQVVNFISKGTICHSTIRTIRTTNSFVHYQLQYPP